MICLYGETHLSNFTLIFFTYICVPFLQKTQTALRFFNFLIDPHHQPESSYLYSEENPEWELDLPVSQFQDLKLSNKDGGDGEIDGHEEMCSICLMEFEKEEWVNKLPKCGHIFHMECLEKWLDRCQFTCPLCRSSVLRLRLRSLPCKKWASLL